MASQDKIRLNLGAGDSEISGFTPVDLKEGQPAFPLEYDDESVEIIYASHVLEHFPAAQIQEIIADWFRALEPGGTIYIGVPDFHAITTAMNSGELSFFEGSRYICGGWIDDNDRHGVFFNQNVLAQILASTGFVDIKGFEPFVDDTTRSPWSLNMCATKPSQVMAPNEAGVMAPQLPADFPIAEKPTIAIALSMGRYGPTAFTEFVANTASAVRPKAIASGGGFPWEVVLTNSIEQAMESGADYILFADYDSVWTVKDVHDMVAMAQNNPQIAAFYPVQMNRHHNTPLVMDAKLYYGSDLTVTPLGHFGLTLIRREVFETMPHPWFWGMPNPDNGRWDERKTDPDIQFWKNLASVGGFAAQCNNVVIGHIQDSAIWPGEGGKVVWQDLREFRRSGKPKSASLDGWPERVRLHAAETKLRPAVPPPENIDVPPTIDQQMKGAFDSSGVAEATQEPDKGEVAVGT